jgi:hypothetical protein
LSPAAVAELTDAQIDALLSHHPDDRNRAARRPPEYDADDDDHAQPLFFAVRRALGQPEADIAREWAEVTRGRTGA